MEFFDHPILDQAVKLWEERGFDDDECLYSGTSREVAGKLSASIERRKWLYDRQMSLQEQRNRANERDLGNESQAAGDRDDALSKKLTAERHIRQELLDQLDAQVIQDSKRSYYLITSLRNRGLNWPVPECTATMPHLKDICAFLGSLDSDFDVLATYTELEAYVKSRV
ncbi:MAG: hypothetical protein Q9168_003855 [Polycauliona sp. 1 TL-2023]